MNFEKFHELQAENKRNGIKITDWDLAMKIITNLEKQNKELGECLQMARNPEKIIAISDENNALRERVIQLEKYKQNLESVIRDLRKPKTPKPNPRIKELERANAELTRQIEAMKRYANFD